MIIHIDYTKSLEEIASEGNMSLEPMTLTN